MKALCAAVLGVCVVAFAGTAQAQDDNAKKLVGVWVLEKTESGGLPAGTTVEFTKDNKLKIVAKENDKELKLDGTYKIAKDKLTVELKFGDMDIKEELTIKKVTDDALELEKDKKVDTFKKKKEKDKK